MGRFDVVIGPAAARRERCTAPGPGAERAIGDGSVTSRRYGGFDHSRLRSIVLGGPMDLAPPRAAGQARPLSARKGLSYEDALLQLA